MHALLRGIDRLKGREPLHRKAPVTIDILQRIAPHYDRNTAEGKAHWACILTMFFGLLRKSNVTVAGGRAGPNSNYAKDRHVLRLSDLTYHSDGSYTIRVRSTKTLQDRSRAIEVALPIAVGSDLCPATAMTEFLHATDGLRTADGLPLPDWVRTRPHDAPLFGYHNPDGTWHALSYHEVLVKFQTAIHAIGLDPAQYAAHSFRRGPRGNLCLLPGCT